MKKKILVVDDDPKIITLSKFILEKNGYEVLTSNGGKKAIEMAKNEKPDLIILDIMMPEMDGYQVCERLKKNKNTKQIPIMMLTALDMGQDFEKALKKGADWYITKPFEADHLLKRINYLIEKKQRFKNIDINKLKTIAKHIRIDIIKMLTEAGSGHPGGSLSIVEILVSLYFGQILQHDPKNPKWNQRDIFLLSKGHACPALYACLAHCGYFPKEELLTLRKFGTRLQGHPAVDKGLSGIEVASGSLGQGLSIAVGAALGFKLNNSQQKVYCLLGDGECDEGQVWEAAMAATHYRLENLCGIVDYNNLQIDGFVSDIMTLAPFKEKWIAFGWEVIEINGHNFNEIFSAFQRFYDVKDKPTMIIAHTIKGKGVSFMENAVQWHGKAPKKEQAEAALKELESL